MHYLELLAAIQEGPCLLMCFQGNEFPFEENVTNILADIPVWCQCYSTMYIYGNIQQVCD